MQHPVTRRTRLVSPLARLFHIFFSPRDPRAWATYHMVPERRGTLWIHCHGLRRRKAANLEFTGVPAELRREAVELMFALVRIAKSRRRLAADDDFAERFTARGQQFAAVGTLRATARNDRRHTGMLRVVDYGRTLADGFPKRLFSAHLVAKADATADAGRREALYRKALAIFPGEYAEANEGADTDPVHPDLTELQHKCNIGAWYGLAEALRDQDRPSEAITLMADTIARAPGWAGVYRDRLMQSGGAEDRYFRFWRDVDITDIALRPNPTAPATAAPARDAASGGQSGGFGRRQKDAYAELPKRG